MMLQGEGPIVDVRFAPASLGLKLAACTSDGKARLFECQNVLALADWLNEDIETIANASATNVTPSDVAGVTATSAALDWMSTPFGGGLLGDDRGETLAIGGR